MSPFIENGVVWRNGKLIPWKDATIHLASHVVHYGSALFEGLRAYNTPKGTAVFRLQDHTRRLYNSCKIYRMDVPYSQDEFNRAVIETVRANGLKSCYIRPIIYRGYNMLGVNPFPNPVDCAVLLWEWGKYLGPEAMESGVDVCVSSWWRMAPNTFPALAKAGANYLNSQLIKMEALLDGYEEGIALNIRGHISEGSGENLFLVNDGIVLTPPLSSSVLPGITRDSVMTLFREMGVRVVEETIPREMLYIADEVFFTGSAAEVTPIRSIDKIVIGNGKRGPLTEKVQKAFFEVIDGKREDAHRWLTFI
ncbi:MAG: branched chain amino acid aminotransferase [Candidatus Aminicenantes bacterium RBG_16_63_14]|nr:MAG: branched chain amino acid aminotransferase [Candidatus Aminicenantes bacterium RBG_16_63_14]OGD27610.1 MAG: branched chain amino acid aminotransferase [Candidatus Aminicenantes bacterium RBG_19FT_COMBO_65_30]